MPHSTLKMQAGVNVTETPTLNEVSYQSTNLIRFIPDAKGLGLAQKMGGWINYYGSALSSPIRALKGWSDLNGNNFLGIGAQASLNILNTNGTLQDITPQYKITDVTPNFTTTASSTSVVVTDASFTPATVDYVYYQTPVAVGGITLYGSYPIQFTSKPTYTIYADAPAIYGACSATSFSISGTTLTISGVTGTFGPGMTISGTGVAAGTVIVAGTVGGTTFTISQPASGSTSGALTGNVAATYAFSTLAGSTLVQVTFPNHNLNVGQDVYVTIPTTVGGVTISGRYTVTSLGGFPSTANSAYTNQMFCISASTTAGATAGPVYENSGNIQSYYFVTTGAAPSGSGYGQGGYGQGGYGVGLSPNGFFQATASGTTLTVTSVTSGNIIAGQTILTGPSALVGLTIVSQLTSNEPNGTYNPSGASNLRGTYQLSGSASVASPAAVTTSIYSSGTNITATDWTLDNFGADLIACPAGVPATQPTGVISPALSPVYYYLPNGTNSTAQILGEQTPLVNAGIFVAMPERQIVAYGSSFNLAPDPLNIRWSDAGDPTTWIASSTNQAGSYRLPSGSKIVAGIQGPQQGLIWTDIELWAMQYVGLPFVYGFNKIGTNCGAISQKSVGTLNNVVYWMSQKQFYMLSGGGPVPLSCTVWDAVFQNLNTNYVNNIRCAVNTQFNEVMWFYPSSSSSNGENDSYVKYNTVLQCWDYGSLGRSAWIDQSVLGPPIGAGTDQWLYQHEIGNDAPLNGVTQPMNSFMQTGYFQIADGDAIAFVDQIWPDLKFNTYSGAAAYQTQPATVNLTISYTNYPADLPSSYNSAVTPAALNSFVGASGNYPTGNQSTTSSVQTLTIPITQKTEYISLRIRARFMSFALSNPSDSTGTGTFWRLGAMKFRYQPDGRY